MDCFFELVLVERFSQITTGLMLIQYFLIGFLLFRTDNLKRGFLFTSLLFSRISLSRSIPVESFKCVPEVTRSKFSKSNIIMAIFLSWAAKILPLLKPVWTRKFLMILVIIGELSITNAFLPWRDECRE